ncbi:cobyric acid synthase [Planctobacterium marinum]|uniref:cobyric acid synthase n=1 Tax=Planctobacterium marinum TaxID=1631968 RepID=UPI001E284FCC|nr:cobyric acid synthase [Planctobacterium marinum]MCC2606754.1 cobyric acid synthase [Planctobacterium marinum]
MLTNTLMIQGTSSDAGKSMLVAALCRCLYQRGLRVAPFKPQNMALNSAVTADGGEIGRAQALQAQAAGIAPHVDMNPILLKPSSDTGAQVIIQGKAITDMQAAAYHDYKKVAMCAVLESHQRLAAQYDCIIVEGAGSPAEVNLREGDIANMGFAEAVDCPVILIADIDRGGVFAQLVGTLELLSPSEQQRVVGFVINKFRGDIGLLESGLDWLAARTGKSVLGVLPFLPNLQLAAEDAIETSQASTATGPKLIVAVPVFSRISNHTDFDMLRAHPEVKLIYVPPHSRIPACDLIILPGSKNVRADLAQLRAMQWDQDILRHLRYGGKVLGICGGYQMLGECIADPDGIEGPAGESKGLALLKLSTRLQGEKQLTQNQGVLCLTPEGDEAAIPVSGYQIHVGVTQTKEKRCFALLENNLPDGAVSTDNQVAGTYLHGLFDQPEATRGILAWAGADIEVTQHYEMLQEAAINRLAEMCDKHLDWTKITPLIGKLTGRGS